MKKKIFLTFIFGLVVILSLLTIVTKPLISDIKNTAVFDGCGCSFQLPSQQQGNFDGSIFYSGYAEGKTWMNIDGKDTELILVSSTGNNSNLKKGNKSTQNYRADNVSVTVEGVITNVCNPTPQDCKFTAYAATITAKKLNRQQTIKVTGGCGC